MTPALIIGSSVLAVLLLLLVLRQFAQSLRARGRAEIDKRYPAAEVLLSETLAQSFGQQSKGVVQARGNGALALTNSELFFGMYVPDRELKIPLASIKAVSLVRSHLGKTQGTDLLHVRYETEGAEDAIAWRVPKPAAWKAKLDELRG